MGTQIARIKRHITRDYLSKEHSLPKKLILKDIDPNRIKTAGFGERVTVRSNNTMEGRTLNRRTEIIIIK